MRLRRRAYLRTAGLLGTVAVTGCLGDSGSSTATTNPNTVLAEPDRQFESSNVAYPAWGEPLPDVTVPAPLEDREVSLRASEKPRLLTFFYSNCPTVCPVLISTLRNVQTHALNNDYGDAVEFYPLTFDPARDDADRLRAYAQQMNVDADAGNWHFLRPQSEDRAKTVIEGEFGVVFQKEPTTTTGTGTHTESGGHHHTANTTTSSDGDHHDHGAYEFVHTSLTLLVNGDDYVERAYRTKSPNAETIIADLRTVRNA